MRSTFPFTCLLLLIPLDQITSSPGGFLKVGTSSSLYLIDSKQKTILPLTPNGNLLLQLLPISFSPREIQYHVFHILLNQP